MEIYTVIVEHVYRQEMRIAAESESDALAVADDICVETDIVPQLPCKSLSVRLTCGEAELEVIGTRLDDIVDRLGCEPAVENEDARLASLISARDEIEAVLEHLDSAIYDLSPHNE